MCNVYFETYFLNPKLALKLGIQTYQILTSNDEVCTLKLGIQTYQILTNDDKVCIPSLSSILLAVELCMAN